MELMMFRKMNKDIKYYGVYSSELEIADGSDILCTARKRFFETSTKQKDRGNIRTESGSYNYSYSLESGYLLKYRKVESGRQTERVTPSAEGYFVETTDLSNHPVKRTYYDRTHKWLRSIYYAESDRQIIMEIYPSDDYDKPALICKRASGTQVLFPFNIPLDKKLTEKLNIITSEPPVYCVTSEGNYYYLSESEYSQREEALKKLLKKENEAQSTPSAGKYDTSFVIDSSRLEQKDEKTWHLKDSTEVHISDEKNEQDDPDDFYSQLESIAARADETIAAREGSEKGDPKANTRDSQHVEKTTDEEKKQNEKTAVSGDKSAANDEDSNTNTARTGRKAKVSAGKAETPDKAEAPDKSEAPDKAETPDKTGTRDKAGTPDKTKTSDKAYKPQNPDDMVQHHDESAEKPPIKRSDDLAAKMNNNADKVPGITSGEETGTVQSTGLNCSFAGECPYQTVDKQIIQSGGRQYFYFGDLRDGKRNGRGRTAMKTGETAYEGQYISDKRDGFGVYYYKSGKLCYCGNWKQNKRTGLGVAFSPSDGSAFIGQWQDDASVNVGATFDSKGRMLYAGNIENGKKNGAGITYNDDDNTFFVGKYKDGSFLGTGTQFSCEGTLLYTGEYRENKRSGNGTEYYVDGSVKYKGEWLDNMYHGEGSLYSEDGTVISGSFRRGKVHGKAKLTDRSGKVIYIGSFVDDDYNGTGRLFNDDGGFAEGRFVDGEPTGIFNEYNSKGKLIYCGEWTDMHRNGRGIEYADGMKVYEGEFENSVYSGQGKLYKDGKVVYIGSFKGGRKNGFGREFENNELIYRGMWLEDEYSGQGILYEEGEARFAGRFEHGSMNGRINEIRNRKVFRKSMYKNGELTYMCEYSDKGIPSYWGNVSSGERSGMGCTFDDSFMKQFEGIFRNNKPDKPMKVILKDLDELPACRELSDSEYEIYRFTPDFVIEKPVTVCNANGIYSGMLRDGMPSGMGTLLFSDHRYTGEFVGGKPEGNALIYTNDGSERRGRVSCEPFEGCRTVSFAEVSYYALFIE